MSKTTLETGTQIGMQGTGEEERNERKVGQVKHVCRVEYIYGLKIFQTPVSEKFLKSRSLNHHITEINYDT